MHSETVKFGTDHFKNLQCPIFSMLCSKTGLLLLT